MSQAVSGKIPSRTWAEIDLGAVRHNVRELKRRAPASQLMAVVKADAYGHGAVDVALAAREAGAESFAVVTVEEGADLRRGGITEEVLVFTDLLSDRLLRAEELRLTVTAHSVTSAKRIAAHPGLRAHLKVNTGMNRWGVERDEVGEARRILGDQLTGVYTHLACADSDTDETKRQLDAFERVLADNPFGGVRVHAANSAGALWHPASHYDCIRPGVAIYGLHPAGNEGDPDDENLRPAMRLKSYVADIRRLEPGEGVSYGMTFRAVEPMRVVTVPVGYAEGYRRALSGKAAALIGGRRRPLLGRVTMDASVFGADESVVVGDEVVLLGEQGEDLISAEEIGRWADTINYEVTTGVDPRRVERSYK